VLRLLEMMGEETMKKFGYIIVSALMLSLAIAGTAWTTETREEKNLNKEAAAISATAKTGQGEKVVAGRLEKEFSVSNTQIKGLREKRLGYGEISIVLSLAQKMPGGVTDANLEQVMTLRQGPPRMGWGEVCKKLGTKLGPVVSQMRTMNRETHREMMHGMNGANGHTMERHQEQHGDRGHEGMGHDNMGGPGMSHGKGR
jgi:hypothetical protein